MATIKTIDDLENLLTVSDSDKLLIRNLVTDKKVTANIMRTYTLNVDTLSELSTFNDTDTLIIQQTVGELPKKVAWSDAKTEILSSINTILDTNFIGTIQAINGGTVNASNEPNHLVISGDVLHLDGSPVPFRANIGDGISDYGKQAIKIAIKNDDLTLNLSALGDDDYYIILRYDSGTTSFSLEQSTLTRIMSTIPPTSPATGQLWYNINTNKNYEWNGSSWDSVYTLILGMVNKSSGSYTIYNRAINDYYESDLTGLAAGSHVDFFHNLFTKRFEYKIRIYQDGSSTLLESNYYFVLSGSGYGQIITTIQGREDMKIKVGASDFMFGGGNQSGDIIIFLKRSF